PLSGRMGTRGGRRRASGRRVRGVERRDVAALHRVDRVGDGVVVTWDAVVTAALLGTERSGAERPAPAGSLGALVARLERGDPDDAERSLLGQMGVLAVH